MLQNLKLESCGTQFDISQPESKVDFKSYLNNEFATGLGDYFNYMNIMKQKATYQGYEINFLFNQVSVDRMYDS